MRISAAFSALLLCSAAASGASLEARPPVFGDVDVFLGVEGGGNTTPGAEVPFGFVVMQPDMDQPYTSGYRTAGRILGFSHTHESGTGGGSKYGNFRVTPQVGSLRQPEPEPGSHEVAWPGYFAVTTGSGIRAELTATRLVGFHRYTFPHSPNAHLIIDVGSVISPEAPTPQHPIACETEVSGPNQLRGGCSFRGGWNPGEYKLYFAARFDRVPDQIGVTDKADFSTRDRQVRTTKEGQTAWAWASFDTRQSRNVGLRLAVSFVSMQKAEANLRATDGWGFDRAQHDAERQWDAALAKITVSGGTAEQRSIFRSALYRVQVMPHDLSGENVWWSSSEPHYEDFYTLWDTFRTQMPLLTVIQPERVSEMVRSLVDTYRHTGWLPDARVAGVNGLTQGGSNGDVLIADAIVKGVKGIDYETAYKALVKDAETDSPEPILAGREEVSTYKRLGYLPLEVSRSGSRTMEYAYDDFAVAQVAQALGKAEEAAEYRRRSLSWTNLWDGKAQSIHPRHANGDWQTPFDRTLFTMSWSSPFYEGTPWQYSTFVPHDVQGLINRLGGDTAFVAWLDAFFAQGAYEPGNEPDILAPWLYAFAGRPDRTQAQVRDLLAKYYKTGRDGLPGNDDAGTMTSWYVWSAIGLYPNAGQDYYLIGSPIFSAVRIDVGGGRRFTIEAPNADATMRYIQSATLNGRPIDRPWLTHAELSAGGTLRLELADKPSGWGSQMRPYSVEAKAAK